MSRIAKVEAVFAILMGSLLLVTWILLFVTGQGPVLSSETVFLLVAEALTGAGLIASGYGLLARRKWGLYAALVALGMLLYCAVYSIGVFAEQGVSPAVAWFVIVAVLTTLFIGRFLRESSVG